MNFETLMLFEVLGHYAQRHYAQGHYAQGNYAQTEITPKEIKLFKENSSDFFRLIFEEVSMFVVWLSRFAPFAK